ncbi:hypothetical protein ACEPAI_3413 [Sanghuangporus weigelae]
MTSAATTTAAYPSAVDERHFHHPHLSAAATAIYGSTGMSNGLNGITDTAAATTNATTITAGGNVVTMQYKWDSRASKG